VIRRLLVPVALIGTVAACGGGADDEAAPAVAETTATTAVSATQATATPESDAGAGVVGDVPDALRFTAPLVGGGDIEMAALAGRPVLLWFWAPW
jgi:hypothetical protein